MKVTIKVWKDNNGKLQPSRFVSSETRTRLDRGEFLADLDIRNKHMAAEALKEAGA